VKKAALGSAALPLCATAGTPAQSAERAQQRAADAGDGRRFHPIEL
jgi:hypothetical protein